jgi:hypothetical protein
MKAPAFSEQLKDLNITNIAQFLSGKQIMIINNHGGHNYGTIGETIQLRDDLTDGNFSGTSMSNAKLSTRTSNSIMFTEFSLVYQEDQEFLNFFKDTYERSLTRLQNKLDFVNSKLEYLEKTGAPILDEKEFLTFTLQNVIEDTSVKAVERAKRILDILNRS